MLLLPETVPQTIELPVLPVPSPCSTEPFSKSVGTYCSPQTDSKECQTEKPASSDLVQMSIRNKILENDLKLKQSSK